MRFGRGHRGPWGHAWDRGWERERTRRGDLKFDILEVVAEQPRHGYDVIRAIAEKRGFAPSAGSIYPTLQLLEDGGHVTSAQIDGRRVYTITDDGRRLLADRPERGSEAGSDDDSSSGLHSSGAKLAAAVAQAVHTLGPDGQVKLRKILDDARKEVYDLLARDV